MIPLLGAIALLVAILVTATLRPFGLPEALVAVPAAAIAVATGLIAPDEAWAQVRELGPTVGFLAAILLLGYLADVEGVFTWLGDRLATASRGHPQRLLGLVFAAAAGTTAVLSLDATVVLLTPVVLLTAARLRVPSWPHSYACAHLSNSASGLLPVSNLTNLLVFSASGLTFLGFAALMALPWAAVIAVEYLVLRRFFAADLRPAATGAPVRQTPHPEAADRPVAGDAGPGVAPETRDAEDPPAAPVGPGNEAQGADVLDPARTEVGPEAAGPDVPQPTPRFALAVLGATLAGFGASSAIGVEPAWVAAAGAAVLAVRALVGRRTRPFALVGAAAPLFCLFVLALGVVVAAVSNRGLADGLGALLPSSTSLLALLATAGIAAVLANLVNNLPATLALLAALGPSPQPALILAVLLGVNIGPNLTYTGSLATLLWRRVATGRGDPPEFGRFVALGALTVPLGLAAATVALWASLALFA